MKMACAYHAEFNAARQAVQQAQAMVALWTGAPTAFLMGFVFFNGPANLVAMLNNLDAMRQAVLTFITSNNLPAKPPDYDEFEVKRWRSLVTRTRARRASNAWYQRLQLVQRLIQTLQGFGLAAWPGAGGAWF
jgi:hypothetical protein